MSIDNILEDAHCEFEGTLHYRQHIMSEDFEKMQANPATKHLYAYCLVDDNRCPFYELHRNNSYCKLPDYMVK
jgi:hypothetical protein